MSVPKPLPFWINNTHCKKPDANVFIIKEKIKTTKEDGTVIWVDNLKYYDDPKRPFWITKPAFRTHEFKKEFEYESNLDKYLVRDSELQEKIKKVLGIYSRKNHLRMLCNSPYIYGADIPMGTLIRNKYNTGTGGVIPSLSTGALDIENEVDGLKRINVMSFMDKNNVYTAYLPEYRYKTIGNERIQATHEELLNVVYTVLAKEIQEYGLNLHIYSAKNELDLIRWVFSNIHDCKTDFIGIWNMDYDIPVIMDRITQNNGSLESIMCHPEVPDKYKFVNYYQDKSDVDHFTYKWHWLTTSSYSQFIDSMCLYSRLNKTKDKESYYTLDYIAKKIIKDGKLNLNHKTITNHWHEQQYNFLEYVAYNIKDVLLVKLIDDSIRMCEQLYSLTDSSMLRDFSKTTAMVRDSAFFYNKKENKIIASVGTEMLTPFDALFTKIGGTVLPPNKAMDIGINVLEESNDLSQVIIGTNDLDAEAEYPTVTASFNLAKETKLFSAVEIKGFEKEDVETFFGDFVSPIENSVALCSKFFKLANYTEMDKIFSEHITAISTTG